jgi:hypothetical protein
MIVENLFKFLYGFIVGMIVEWLGIWIYKKIDPNEESNTKLILLILIQLFILFWLMEEMDAMNDLYLRMGMLSSQVFVFDYAFKRLYQRNLKK